MIPIYFEMVPCVDSTLWRMIPIYFASYLIPYHFASYLIYLVHPIQKKSYGGSGFMCLGITDTFLEVSDSAPAANILQSCADFPIFHQPSLPFLGGIFACVEMANIFFGR